ncbi:MAG: hypothetical protein DRH37_03625 [Deltaproteobacteria bacterium]|nr:MAG: hypothetical protein DRH37_03625 [Deltaproteobacteria bacterium]
MQAQSIVGVEGHARKKVAFRPDRFRGFSESPIDAKALSSPSRHNVICPEISISCMCNCATARFVPGALALNRELLKDFSADLKIVNTEPEPDLDTANMNLSLTYALTE